MKALVIILSIIMIDLWITAGVGTWFVERDTTHVLERAQVAANAADMQVYVNQLQHNMEVRGMTQGYAILVFKSPEYNMKLIYDAVCRVNERLTAIKDIPQNDTTYQVALDDLRGTLRELEIHAAGWFWAHNAWWIITSFVLLIVIIGVGIYVLINY